jgi:hypothetical protein
MYVCMYVCMYVADDRDYTRNEVKKAIYNLKRNKAPGKDGVTAEIY